jgi:hypothetical protein
MNSPEVRVPALSEGALALVRRGVWTVCVGIYLAVFITGIQGGGAELITVGRAAGFTLVAAFLGRTLLGLLAGASTRVAQGPLDTQEGPLGSLVELVSSANVAQQVDEADAA